MLIAIAATAALFAVYALLNKRKNCTHNCGMCEHTCGTSEPHHD